MSPLASAPSVEAAPASSPTPAKGVTARVVAFSLLLTVVFALIIPVIDFKFQNTMLGASPLPPGAIGALLLLLLVVNPLLGLVSKQLRFSRQETLVVYITCLFSCLIPGHGAENLFIPNLLAAFYYATPENKWLDFLVPHLKNGFTPALHNGQLNRQVLDGWYLGGPIPWSAWVGPLLLWGALVLASYLMLACLSAMLRRQWAQNEALSFPLLRLPLEMTQDMDNNSSSTTPFFRNGLMWTGFALVVGVQLLRGTHRYFPEVPDFPMSLDLGPFFSEAPWNQIGWTMLETYPLAVGIAFLLSSEVSFSLWFVYWLTKLQFVALSLVGFPSASLPKAPGAVSGDNFLGFESVGAYLAFAALLFWTGREHFKLIARRALGRQKAAPDEASEIMSYPVAFWGFFGALGFIIGWMLFVGVRLDVALVVWGMYLLSAVVLSRVAVEAGLMSLISDNSPLGATSQLFFSQPSTWLSAGSGVVPATFVQASFAQHMRGFSMPSFLHAFKLAHDFKLARRPFLTLLGTVVTLSLALSLWMGVRLGHENGALSLANVTWTHVESERTITRFLPTVFNGSGGDPKWNWAAFLVGALVTWGTVAMRARFAWFPLHPVGLVMGQSYPSAALWFSIFIGWTCKTLITRFGGNDSYRRTIPFFLGIALGDVVMMLFWIVIDGWQGRSNHMMMP